VSFSLKIAIIFRNNIMFKNIFKQYLFKRSILIINRRLKFIFVFSSFNDLFTGCSGSLERKLFGVFYSGIKFIIFDF